MSEKLSSNQSRAYHLAQQGPSLVANGDQLVVKMLEQLKVTSSGVIQGILAQLSSQVDDYQQPFDPRDLGLYCEGLFTPIDEMLSSELKRMNALSPMYEEVQKTLIGEGGGVGGGGGGGTAILCEPLSLPQTPIRPCCSFPALRWIC